MSTAAPCTTLAEAIRSRSFDALMPKLLAYGALLARSTVLPAGTHAGDIVARAVMSCLGGGRAWRPNESLESCIRRAMLSAAKDMRCEAWCRRRVDEDVDRGPSPIPGADEQIDTLHRMAIVDRAVEGDPLLTAVWDMIRAGDTRAEMATNLALSPYEITNALRRLQDRAAALAEGRDPVRRSRARRKEDPDERTAPPSLPTQDDKEVTDEQPRSARPARDAPASRRDPRRRSPGAAE